MNVDNMFTHHTPTPAQKRRINSLRNCARMLAREIRSATPAGPNQTQSAPMEAGRGVARVGRKMAEFRLFLVRIAYRFAALQMKIFPHYRERRDGCMIASVLEVRKEIPVNGRLVCTDSLPARDRRICVVMQS